MFMNRIVSSPALTEMHELAPDQLDTIGGGHSITATVAAAVILTAEAVALTVDIAVGKVAKAA